MFDKGGPLKRQGVFFYARKFWLYEKFFVPCPQVQTKTHTMDFFLQYATEDFQTAKSRVIQVQQARQSFLDAGGDRDSKEFEELTDVLSSVGLAFSKAKAVMEAMIKHQAAEIDMD